MTRASSQGLQRAGSLGGTASDLRRASSSEVRWAAWRSLAPHRGGARCRAVRAAVEAAVSPFLQPDAAQAAAVAGQHHSHQLDHLAQAYAPLQALPSPPHLDPTTAGYLLTMGVGTAAVLATLLFTSRFILS